MKPLKSEESGVILVIVVFALALAVFGYVAFNNISKSREANEAKEAAEEITDRAEGIIKGN